MPCHLISDAHEGINEGPTITKKERKKGEKEKKRKKEGHILKETPSPLGHLSSFFC